MAKGNVFIGTMAGKVGDIVFSRRAGQQIARAYIRNPKDAKSVAQYVQRTQLNNLVAFYRVARLLLDHSFTSRKSNQSSYNRFVAANLNAVKVYSPKGSADNGFCVIAPYRISQGVLPSIQTTGSGDNVVTNIALGSLVPNEYTTIGEFSTALVANNPNILQGDQITYVSAVQSTSGVTAAPTASFTFHELTLDMGNTDLLSSALPVQATAVNAGFLAHGVHVATGGFAWIISRKVDSTLLCSTQSLILNSNAVFNEYSSDTAKSIAVASYGANADVLLNPDGNVVGSGADVQTYASIAALTLNGTQINTQASEFDIPAGTTASVVITGSHFPESAAVQLLINNNAYDVNVSSVTKTKIQGTINVPTKRTVSNISISLDGVSLFNARLKSQNGGDENLDI